MINFQIVMVFNDFVKKPNFWSSICIQLLLFHNNQNNVYSHSFPVSLVIVELCAAKASKREQKARWIFYQKTPTHYQWTTIIYARMKMIKFPNCDGF
jgi:hypothetical protein